MEVLVRAASHSVGVKEGQRAVRLRMLNMIDDLQYFDKAKAAVEAELEAVMATLELGQTLQSMRGIGSIIAAAFIGEVGDVSRFSDWKEVRSLAGLNLVENSSGKHKGNTRISKRGRPYLRYMLYMAGESAYLHCSEMREFCRYLQNRKKNPLHRYQATVATGLKVMRILFHLAKTGERYDPSKALGAARLQQIASHVRKDCGKPLALGAGYAQSI